MSGRGGNHSKRGKVAGFVHRLVSPRTGGRGSTSGSGRSDDDLSSQGNVSSSVPVSEPSGRVNLDAIINEDGKMEISISPSGQFIHGGCQDPARWFGDLFSRYNFEEFYPTPKSISKEVYAIWYCQFRHIYSHALSLPTFKSGSRSRTMPTRRQQPGGGETNEARNAQGQNVGNGQSVSNVNVSHLAQRDFEPSFIRRGMSFITSHSLHKQSMSKKRPRV